MQAPQQDAPFGRVLTAMVTPFRADGSLDLPAAAAVARHLVEQGNDGLVVSGTTGESPTTSDAEKESLLRTVLDAVGDRAHVLAGVGTFDTAHTVELARGAEKAGAHGLLVVTPYYSRPPGEGLLAHFRAVADSVGLPVMLYDIPVRTGLALGAETLLRLGEHPRIVAVKDATRDLGAATALLARSPLALYSGDDIMTLPLLAVGAVGTVGVATHAVSRQVREMVLAFPTDPARARQINQALLPAYEGFFRTQGAILAKAAVELLGLAGRHLRLPLVPASDAQVATLRADLLACGVQLP